MSETQAPAPFRAATPAPTATPSDSTPTSTQSKGESVHVSKDNDDVPPSLYQTLEKQPYAVKFLGLELYNDDEDFQEVRDQANALDAYVLKQLKSRGLKDDSGSYKEIIDALYKHIGRSSNEDPLKSVKRLSVAAGAVERLESAKLPPVLSAQSLSVKEFEDVQP